MQIFRMKINICHLGWVFLHILYGLAISFRLPAIDCVDMIIFFAHPIPSKMCAVSQKLFGLCVFFWRGLIYLFGYFLFCIFNLSHPSKNLFLTFRWLGKYYVSLDTKVIHKMLRVVCKSVDDFIFAKMFIIDPFHFGPHEIPNGSWDISYNITPTNHKPCIGYLPFSSQISFGIARAVIVICFNSIYVEGQMGEKG